MSSGEMVFYPKRSTAIWMLLGSAVFVAGGIGMILSGNWLGLVPAGFFALCVPVFIIQLCPGSSYLRIEETGFTFCSLFRKTSIPWSAVAEFFVVTLRQRGMSIHKMVGFNFVPSYDKSRTARRIAAGISDCEGALPDTYGRTVEELADLMNSRLRQAHRRERPPELQPGNNE